MLSTKNSATVPFKLALVTGASSGIGAALCRLLARQGIPLLMTARDQKRLQALKTELESFVPVTFFVADLADGEARQGLIVKIHEAQPDLVVNNAGFGLYGEAIVLSTKEQLEMVDLNVKALLELSLEATKALIAGGKKGVILNISSASDLMVFPGLAVYAASKAFVTKFSQSLDTEVRSKGVSVLAACPGVVSTEFRKRASAGTKSGREGTDMDVSFAAEELWKQVCKRKQVHYFDWKTRLMLFFGRHIIPQAVTSKILFNKIRSLKN